MKSRTVLDMKLKNISPLGVMAILAVITAVSTMGLLTVTQTLQSTGSVKSINVEVFWDVQLTQLVSDVDWGIPESGDSITKTVYIRNLGSAPMTLNMIDGNWNPGVASNYLTMSWNREAYVLPADGVVEATLTLDVSPSITGITDFSFDIVIQGTG